MVRCRNLHREAFPFQSYCIYTQCPCSTTQRVLTLSGSISMWSVKCQRLYQNLSVTRYARVALWVTMLEVGASNPNPAVPHSDVYPLLQTLKDCSVSRRLGTYSRTEVTHQAQ